MGWRIFSLFDQRNQSAGADAVSSGFNHSLGLLEGADAAGGLNPHVGADVLNSCQLRRTTDNIFQALNIHPNITAETEQDAIINGLVASNHGVAIIPYPLGGAPYNTKIIHITNNIPPRNLYLMWNKEQYLPPAAEYFRDFIIRSGEVFTQFMEKKHPDYKRI